MPETQIQQQRIAWLITSMGYGDSLLYWEPILENYVARFPNTRVFTSGRKTVKRPGISVVDAVRIHRFFVRPQQTTYQKNILLISPAIILTILKYRPHLIILSEFGLLTLYGLLSNLFIPRTHLLLLVESNPHQLAGKTLRGPRRWMRRLVCKAAAHILTNNSAGSNYLINELGVSEEKITTRPYLVSTINEQPAPQALTSVPDLNHQPENYVAFLYVGQITRRKGVFDLIDALIHLPETLLNRCRLWIVGSGDCLDELEGAISRQGLTAYVKLFGSQPYSLLGHFYRCADVFVFPTRHDYRALVGFEALALGLPLIHSRGDGAVSEVVDEGRNGFSFDPGDIVAISTHMSRFIENPDTLKAFGQRSRERAADFSVDKAADALIDASCAALGLGR